MYNSLKKLLGIGGVLFLLMGSVSWGQNDQYCKYDTECNSDEVCDAWICVKQEDSMRNKGESNSPKTGCEKNGKRVGTDAVGVCNCNDGYKRVDDECKSCSTEGVCCGIELNTKVPFIGNCIELSNKSWTTTGDADETTVSEKNAFPVLMGGLTKMMVTIILLIGFIGILVGGVMISASWGSDSWASEGKKLIGRVIVALALLGASGVILRLINPNFFG